MTDSENTSVRGSSGFSSGAETDVPSGRGLAGRVRALSTASTPGRLPSLRTRDLTLGGALKKKKTFEPNVHTLRKNKDDRLNKDVPVALKKEGRERDVRRRKEKPQTIQSHSIFEQGPADAVCKTGWHRAADRLYSTTSLECKAVKKEKKDPEDDEDEILCKLKRDDFIDDPGLRNDAKLKPIQLPLSQSNRLTKNQTLTATTTSGTDNPSSVCGALRKEANQGQLSLVELLQELNLSGKEELFFIQLPDCMPCLYGKNIQTTFQSTAAESARNKEKPEDKRPAYLQTQGAAKKEDCPVLSQLPEGFLGKLQIRKSGKIKLKLGDVIMDISEGVTVSFLQQLVSVHLSEGRIGDMMVLGNIYHKLVLSPDFQALLRQAVTPRPHNCICCTDAVQQS